MCLCMESSGAGWLIENRWITVVRVKAWRGLIATLCSLTTARDLNTHQFVLRYTPAPGPKRLYSGVTRAQTCKKIAASRFV